jgi:hypothetical protein
MADTRQIRQYAVRGVPAAVLAGAALVLIACGDGAAALDVPDRPPMRLVTQLPEAEDGRQPTPWITVGKDTTYVTYPVDEDGYVDYVAALNASASEGVTVENNAAVLLVRAMSLIYLRGADREQFYKLLGVAPTPMTEVRFSENDDLGDERGVQFGATIDSMVPWSESEYPTRAIWLREHNKALDWAVEAVRRPRCYFPIVRPADAESIYDVLVSALPASREISRGLTVRALFRIHEGKIAEAEQDLLACHRLARLVASGPLLIHGTFGRSIEIGASLADAALLEYGNLSAGDALAYRDQLRKLPPLPSLAHHLDHGERLLFLGATADMARKQQPELEGMLYSWAPLVSPEFMQPMVTAQMNIIWDEALRTSRKEWDRWVAAVRTPITSGRQKQLEALLTELRPFNNFDAAVAYKEGSPELAGERMGRMLVAKLLPALKDAAVIEERTRMRADLVQLGCALAAYHAERGAYPETLEALQPAYCTEVSADRFTGKPLRYRRQDRGYLLYSVGENAADDGGRPSNAHPPGDDIVLQISGKQRASRWFGSSPRFQQLVSLLLVLTALGVLTIAVIRLSASPRTGTGPS